jgi:hypothetical protein
MPGRRVVSAVGLALAITCAACTASSGRSAPVRASAGGAGPAVIMVGSFDSYSAPVLGGGGGHVLPDGRRLLPGGARPGAVGRESCGGGGGRRVP